MSFDRVRLVAVGWDGMIIDSRTLDDGTSIEADLVIIGGGLAGIVMGRELAGTGISVAILESGGVEEEAETSALYNGRARRSTPDETDEAFDYYLDDSRRRWLGGAGNAWGGKSVPLDAWDFAERPWVPESGWPMSRGDLQPFYDRACDHLDIPRFDRDYDQEPVPGRPPLVIGEDPRFSSAPRAFTRYSGRYGNGFDTFRTGFAEAPNISLYLNANVTELRLDRAGTRIEDVGIATLNGRRHRARGGAVILAVGGIENARLLLASGGIGDHSDWVGRCFQGHSLIMMQNAGESLLGGFFLSDRSESLSLYTDNDRDQVHCVLSLNAHGQREYQLPNITFTLYDRDRPFEREFEAARVVAQAVDTAGAGGSSRRAVGYLMAEQSVNRDSRISLTDERDALGMQRVRLDWEFSQYDVDAFEGGAAALGRELGRHGAGRMIWPRGEGGFLDQLRHSNHHIGTTRMHQDPARGVVDSDCRVHGIANLYIAGSSVFPTSGIANPTLTLLALAIRLTDHLKPAIGGSR